MKEPTKVIPRIKYIKAALKMPYHVFFRDNNDWVFWLENDKGEHLEWTSRTLAGAVEEGLAYTRHEIAMGTAIEPEEKKKKEKPKN